MKAIDNALSDSEKNMITPISVMNSLIRQTEDQLIHEEFNEKDERHQFSFTYKTYIKIR